MKHCMKITAGLGSVDDYIPFIEAGADEFFAGYVPENWSECGGEPTALNRREVCYYPVQLGADSELEILSELVRIHGVPVTIAVNSLFYLPEQYPLIRDILRSCRKRGFDSFIVADPVLLEKIREWGMAEELKIHISGELGEMNAAAVAWCREKSADRIIFHRKVSLRDMASMIRQDKEANPGEVMEFEAFALNEMCHFHGGFCYTIHCDALPPMCRVPWKLGARNEQKPEDLQIGENLQISVDADIPGSSGCGLCALYDMAQMGITHLKLVSRGNYSKDTLRDIRILRSALDILRDADSRDVYRDRMKRRLFPEGCSGNCYYPGQ